MRHFLVERNSLQRNEFAVVARNMSYCVVAGRAVAWDQRRDADAPFLPCFGEHVLCGDKEFRRGGNSSLFGVFSGKTNDESQNEVDKQRIQNVTRMISCFRACKSRMLSVNLGDVGVAHLT